MNPLLLDSQAYLPTTKVRFFNQILRYYLFAIKSNNFPFRLSCSYVKMAATQNHEGSDPLGKIRPIRIDSSIQTGSSSFPSNGLNQCFWPQTQHPKLFLPTRYRCMHWTASFYHWWCFHFTFS